MGAEGGEGGRGAESYLGSSMAAEARAAFESEASGKTIGTEAQHAEYRGSYGASWLKQVRPAPASAPQPHVACAGRVRSEEQRG